MKKSVLISCGLLVSAMLNAQKPFPMVYKSQWPVEVKWRMSNEDKTLALGGDLRELSMLDAVTGKVLWSINFKEKFGIKKANAWDWDYSTQAVWVKFKTDEKDVEQTLYFDERTGEKIEDITNRVRSYGKSKTKRGWNWPKSYKVYAGKYDDEATNVHVQLDYVRKVTTSAMGKGTKSDITLKSTGAYNWTTTFKGNIIRALCYDGTVSAEGMFGGEYINMVVANNRVFVVYEGISCFDLTNGNKLWETSFDNADFNFGLMKSSQTLGQAAMPLVEEDGVYVADLSKGQSKVKKLDLNTGAVIWESAQFGKDDVVPDLFLLDGTLVARFGGELEVQTYIPGTEGRPDVCKKEFKMVGPYGVRAYDAKSGALKWETFNNRELGDKFKGGISNMIVSGSNLYFASSKNAYCIEASSGKLVFKTDIGKAGIGIPDDVWIRKDALIIEAAMGVASVQLNGGSLNFTAKTKKNFGSFGTVDAFYVWVGKSALERYDFVRVDLDNGQILGIQKATGYPQFTPDYEQFLKYDGNKIFRFKTRP